MTKKEAQKILRTAGYPISVDGNWGKWSRRALRDAIRMFAFSRSERGGWSMPRVGGRLSKSRARLLRHVEKTGGKCSPRFKYVEFRCKGESRGLLAKEDNWIRCTRSLVRRLEVYSDAFGKPTIISACRSRKYNSLVGGATLSQHLYTIIGPLVTFAADINPMASHQRVRKIWGIGGIGYNNSSGLVAHVDTRPYNSIWTYPR